MTIPSSFQVGQGFAFFVDNQYQFSSSLSNRQKLALRSKDLVELALAFIVVLAVLAVVTFAAPDIAGRAALIRSTPV